ncbi:biopolymer transporter ExbD [Pyxidicoccus parkwayensis]|uniref:Biopolymer transporter ExbD n=1 Tax=Pyxidicoccus parkwayensis TaxID=2813578 RepID=A0ABX7NPC1_9BACT|nr:biopolymer transporter ExbD [Pyxidicoccus parkwaysis]QSQ20715.1 biopolymer transporter ExbD [Pyxidicoccus parkwaysis]
MGMSAGGRQGGPKSEINITPLVDVVLVLLIIFMVVTPMMQSGKPVDLPKATRVEGEAQKDPLVLSVTPDRKVFVESDAYPDEAALKARLQAELSRQPGRRVLLKADQSLACGDVRKVIQMARAAGVERVAFGVESLEPQ